MYFIDLRYYKAYRQLRQKAITIPNNLLLKILPIIDKNGTAISDGAAIAFTYFSIILARISEPTSSPFFLFGDGDADIDSDSSASHALAASQGFGVVPVGFGGGLPVATLRPCLLPSSAPSDDGDDGDGLSGIPHPDN